MEVGAEVWYKDAVDGWMPANILKRDDTTGQIKFVVQVKKGKTKEDFNVLANKDQEIPSLKLMNTAEDSELENLINLPFLHEPAILYCLELRYFRSQIYTYTGPILIAVNPFKKVDLYGQALLDKYFKYGLDKSQGLVEDPLAPHPFAIADAAFRFMMGAIDGDFTGKGEVGDQSILISGESGAGKTESTKIVLRYLTTVASEALEVKTEGSVMDKVLKSNPILEALGNAKTIRNDNSSRFGKFIELKFDNNGHLIGGFIRTYLLEKVRLTSQQLNERNFHIFYQMGVGGNFKEKERWSIASPRDFTYSNQGKCFGIERINDEADYADLRHALKTLRFEEDEVLNMFDIVAGLLHLGQLRFDHLQLMGEDASEISKDADVTNSLQKAMSLLGISQSAFLKAVTERTVIARNDKYQKKLTNIQASDARDSVARIVYGKLFDWVVATVNVGIQTSGKVPVRSEIAVLDIFGFECLTENSFEQLCINYTNETLQQQFNQFIFKLEQAEYEEEGIEWSFVSFPDNQDCLDLIENRRKSIFRLLDDECMTAAGTDVKFASRMITELAEYDRLSVTPAQKISQQFSINHYAGEVVYSAKTFIDKNKDELPREAMDLMASSTQPLVKLIFTTNFAPDPLNSNTPEEKTSDGNSPKINTKGNSLTSPTICTQFKAQLGSLMAKIQSTKPHYIRCIKPNDQNKPDLLNRVRTTEQLRYGGVLEAVRVARSGFPVRFSHEEFYGRYRPIANPFSVATKSLPRYLKGGRAEAETFCLSLLDLMWDDSVPHPPASDKYFAKTMRKVADAAYWKGRPHKVQTNSIQLGKGKVFLRKVAHDLFESRRSKQGIVTARRIQATIRKWLARVYYLKALKSVFRLQIAIRYFLFRTRFVRRRRLHASMRIQTAYRCYRDYKKFTKMARAILSAQTLFRSKLARRVLLGRRIESKTLLLQTFARASLARKKYVNFIGAVVKLQGYFRIKRAKVELKELRIKAKDVGRLQSSNDDLKQEIERMKAAIEEAKLEAIRAREIALMPPSPAPVAVIEDYEKDREMENGKGSTVEIHYVTQYIPQYETTQADDDSIILTPKQRFDKNLNMFKRIMSQGIMGRVYSMVHDPTDCVLTFREPSLLCFGAPKRSMLMRLIGPTFPDLLPLSACDILEIHAGIVLQSASLVASLNEKDKEERFFVSILFGSSMVTAIEVKTPESRNFIVNGLRSLVSELQMELVTPLGAYRGTKPSAPVDESTVDYKLKYEQLAAQILALSNDVFEREEELLLMRKREKMYQQRIATRDKYSENDDVIRRRLSVRLEKLSGDREDVTEER